MDFENPQNDAEQENEITDTQNFERSVEIGQLEKAESWLMENKDRHDARWLDHRSLTLFRAHRANKDWTSAKRMIDLAQDENGRRGRRLKLAEESGETY